jgi:hypothetical protein
MGLDIRVYEAVVRDHAWSSSYSTFGAFRTRLAAAEGFDLDEMTGFGGKREWSEIESSLVPLLNHSDCDGTLHPYEYENIMIDRLRGIIREWDVDDYMWQWGEKLATALEQCKIEWERGERHLYLKFA